MSDPEVSVVMSVYNGETHLADSIDSILNQEGVSLEFIIVDDGSTDGGAAILEEYAGRDNRIRIIRQENQGLTQALIRGCAAARGNYIARQDVGDISLPGRLVKQLNWIRENKNAAFVSCGTRYVGPMGEHLYDVNQESTEATAPLLALNRNEFKGPSSHPSTLFSRNLYERAGGYRPAFYFAQDLDLWIRLAERGRLLAIPEILYEASITVESISGQYRKQQVELTKLILEGARLRRSGLNEQSTLDKAASIRPHVKHLSSRRRRAAALYFIGSCLRRRNNPRAVNYLRQALMSYPLHLKAAARLLGDWTAGYCGWRRSPTSRGSVD
jgi:glycosyltransferase involved in cell wall biosynthesis